jgi:Reverse transcriptase (RNA-dependent DNA polymerase).
MDDLLLFSKTIKEKAERLQHVFDRLRQAKFTLNLDKSHFAERVVEYLGHIQKLEYPLLVSCNESTHTIMLMSTSTWIDKENELQTEFHQNGI